MQYEQAYYKHRNTRHPLPDVRSDPPDREVRQPARWRACEADRPLILCEYAHAMGNSVGNLKEYWDAIREHRLAARAASSGTGSIRGLVKQADDGTRVLRLRRRLRRQAERRQLLLQRPRATRPQAEPAHCWRLRRSTSGSTRRTNRATARAVSRGLQQRSTTRRSTTTNIAWEGRKSMARRCTRGSGGPRRAIGPAESRASCSSTCRCQTPATLPGQEELLLERWSYRPEGRDAAWADGGPRGRLGSVPACRTR